jgi:Subtilase family
MILALVQRQTLTSRSVLVLAASVIAGGLASQLWAGSPREGYTKVVISKRLFAQPNASAALSIIETDGGQVVQDYETETVAYFLSGTLKKLSDDAAALGVEIRPRDDFDSIYLPEGIIDARLGVARSLPTLPLSPPYMNGETGACFLQFVGPILPDWEKQVLALGVTLVQYVPYNAYIAAATPSAMASAAKLPFVQLVEMLHVALKVHPRNGNGGGTHDLVIQLIDAPGIDQAVSSIGARAVGPAKKERVSPAEFSLQATFDSNDLPDILATPLVYGVVEAPVVQISDERVAQSLTSNVSSAGVPLVSLPANPGTYKTWLDGICPFCTTLQADHFWFGEADLGLDDGTSAGGHHPDLPSARVRFGTNFTNDPPAGADTHGTMVAGIAAGDPTAGTDPDGFLYGMGIAPSAGVYVTKVNLLAGAITSVFQSAHDAANPPDQLDTVRVQNHSYNQYTQNPPADCYGGVYTSLSRDFDYSVLDAASGKPMVLTTSAGNQFQQFLGNYDACGSVSRTLTLPPATAKNVLSVGSAEVPRNAGEQWECHFSGQNSLDNIAADSMRGTGTPGWYKPDLFAPSENMVSARSVAQNPVENNSKCSQTVNSPLPTVPYMGGGGTSFAAPVAAGAALLARRFYEEVVHPGCHASSSCVATSASPALTKAMLIAGARSMAGGMETTIYYVSNNPPEHRQNVGPIGPFPNNQQGFGRISLVDVLTPYPFRYFMNETVGLAPGVEWSATLTVHDSALPVKIALVWSDPPGATSTQPTTNSPLVNNLDLRVELPTAPCTRYVGNQLTIPGTRGEESTPISGCNGGTFDTMNNVEIIRFFAPSGVTTFTVYVKNDTGQGTVAQTFALVAYNAFDGSTTAVPPATPVTSDTPSATSVALSWPAITGATGYDIRRKSGGTDYGAPIHVATNSYSDTGLMSNTAYVYQARATRSPFVSGWSAPDLATTSVYTHADANNHVNTGGSVTAADILELRAVVDSVRLAAGLSSPYSYQYVISPGVTVYLEDISQLRTALDAARSTLGLSAVSYTDPGSQLVRNVTLVKAVHINDLRDGVQ